MDSLFPTLPNGLAFLDFRSFMSKPFYLRRAGNGKYFNTDNNFKRTQTFPPPKTTYQSYHLYESKPTL